MDELDAAARRVLDLCNARGWMAATAESCTGGMVASALTAIAGSSAVIDRGFVTYSNEAKIDMLGVPAELIALDGAVSQSVATAMAQGAIEHSRAHLAVSITGIAGPGGGSEHKPVGLVHFACATRDGRLLATERRYGTIGRDAVRRAAAIEALGLMAELAGSR
jgi:nicotinamide-nucleotide amidase